MLRGWIDFKGEAVKLPQQRVGDQLTPQYIATGLAVNPVSRSTKSKHHFLTYVYGSCNCSVLFMSLTLRIGSGSQLYREHENELI